MRKVFVTLSVNVELEISDDQSVSEAVHGLYCDFNGGKNVAVTSEEIVDFEEYNEE